MTTTTTNGRPVGNVIIGRKFTVDELGLIASGTPVRAVVAAAPPALTRQAAYEALWPVIKVETKLTLVCVNGRPVFVQAPVASDGKVRVDLEDFLALAREVGLPAGACIAPF